MTMDRIDRLAGKLAIGIVLVHNRNQIRMKDLISLLGEVRVRLLYIQYTQTWRSLPSAPKFR